MEEPRPWFPERKPYRGWFIGVPSFPAEHQQLGLEVRVEREWGWSENHHFGTMAIAAASHKATRTKEMPAPSKDKCCYSEKNRTLWEDGDLHTVVPVIQPFVNGNRPTYGPMETGQ